MTVTTITIITRIIKIITTITIMGRPKGSKNIKTVKSVAAGVKNGNASNAGNTANIKVSHDVFSNLAGCGYGNISGKIKAYKRLCARKGIEYNEAEAVEWIIDNYTATDLPFSNNYDYDYSY